MRGIRRFVVVAAVALLGGAALVVQPGAVAQDATPAAEEGMAPEGLTFALLGFADGVTLPGPVAMEVARTGFEPRSGFPFFPADPTSALVVVEAGSLTARVDNRAWSISRGAALQQAMATDPAAPDMADVVEEVAPGAEATLQVGDVAYVPGGISGEVRNDGAEPAAALIVLFIPSDTPPAEATPAP